MSNSVKAVTKAQLVAEATLAKQNLDVAAGELAQDILDLDADKGDRPDPAAFTLPASGWTADATVSGYHYHYDLAAAGVTANHCVVAILAPGSQGTAAACGLCPTIGAHVVEGAGKIRFWAISAPESAMTGTYTTQRCAPLQEGETRTMAYGFVNVGGGAAGTADAIVSRLGLYLDNDGDLAQEDEEEEGE
ncbi:MAG: hypothetical protein IJR68_01480 [Fretibacterium sp.]|nr:hypothetical protein [Fretibacterium sp.]